MNTIFRERKTLFKRQNHLSDSANLEWRKGENAPRSDFSWVHLPAFSVPEHLLHDLEEHFALNAHRINYRISGEAFVTLIPKLFVDGIDFGPSRFRTTTRGTKHFFTRIALTHLPTVSSDLFGVAGPLALEMQPVVSDRLKSFCENRATKGARFTLIEIPKLH